MIFTGLIGYPLHYTLSPRIHNAAFKALGLRGIYLPLPVKAENLTAFMKGLRRKNFRGLNVTVPYKERVLDFIDELSAEAAEIRAVNTLVMDGRRVTGHNTDLHGFRESLADKKIRIRGRKVLLIGGGGAGRACACVIRGQKPSTFLVSDLDETRVKTVAMAFGAEPVKFSRLEAALGRDPDLVVNASPCDMQESVLPVLKSGSVYYDLNYRFGMNSKQGVKVLNGLAMLVRQAAHSFSLWTGETAPIQAMETAAGLK
jgi:shikimate dehydrogenase